MKVIQDSIINATKNNNQKEELGNAIYKWFEALVKGNELIGDDDKVKQRIEIILAQITIDNINKN